MRSHERPIAHHRDTRRSKARAIRSEDVRPNQCHPSSCATSTYTPPIRIAAQPATINASIESALAAASSECPLLSPNRLNHSCIEVMPDDRKTEAWDSPQVQPPHDLQYPRNKPAPTVANDPAEPRLASPQRIAVDPSAPISQENDRTSESGNVNAERRRSRPALRENHCDADEHERNRNPRRVTIERHTDMLAASTSARLRSKCRAPATGHARPALAPSTSEGAERLRSR